MARIGESLTNARLRRGLSIEQVAGDTRIAARFIEALESEDFGALPAPVYVRGFLRSYASFLRIDPASLLSQLPEDGGPRVASPDSFVGGPVGRAAQHQQRTDPFKRPETPVQMQGGAPERPNARQAPPPRAMPPPAARDQGTSQVLASVPAAQRRGVVPRDELPEEEARFRSKPAGVLSERGMHAEGDERGGRVLLLAGVGIFVLLAVLAGAVFVTSRGGGGGDGAAISVQPGTVATATVRSGAVISVGSATATPRGGATAATTTGATAGTPGATAAPGAATPTTAPGQPTATPRPQATSTPESEPTVEPTATATSTIAATQAPTASVTPTPLPPTPTPSPIPRIAHPSGLEECIANGGKCGPDSTPIRVICPPDGDWFVDVTNINGTFTPPNDTWRVRSWSGSNNTAGSACNS